MEARYPLLDGRTNIKEICLNQQPLLDEDQSQLDVRRELGRGIISLVS